MKFQVVLAAVAAIAVATPATANEFRVEARGGMSFGENQDEEFVAGAAVGYDFACAVRERAVSCWGWNHLGQLGAKTSKLMLGMPRVLPDLTVSASVASANSHSCAGQEDGSVWCWGSNRWGELGDGTNQARDMPVSAAGVADVVEVAVGRDHSCVLDKKNGVICWGSNSAMQLGVASRTGSGAVPGPL